jgi:hypothetical protein
VTEELAESSAGGVTGLGLNEVVNPLGGGGALKVTAALNESSELMVADWVSEPATSIVIAGIALSEKSGFRVSLVMKPSAGP